MVGHFVKGLGLVLAGIVLAAFLWYGWPTVWMYPKAGEGFVRIHRITGVGQHWTQEAGWQGWNAR